MTNGENIRRWVIEEAENKMKGEDIKKREIIGEMSDEEIADIFAEAIEKIWKKVSLEEMPINVKKVWREGYIGWRREEVKE